MVKFADVIKLKKLMQLNHPKICKRGMARLASTLDMQPKGLRLKSMAVLAACVAVARAGLCAPASQADVFGHARWVGADEKHLTFYPEYLPAFRLGWEVSGDEASWVTFGGADPRLVHPYRNIWHLSSHPDSIYIRVVPDAAYGVVRIYRSGYAKGESGADVQAEIPAPALARQGKHRLRLDVTYGYTDIVVDDSIVGTINLNPQLGPIGKKQWKTAEYLSFPVLGKVGHSDNVKGLRVSNYRAPHSVVADFGEGASLRSSPMLRADFNVSKPVEKATFYATARGIYDAYINGKPVAADSYFAPGAAQYDRTQPYQVYDVTGLVRKGGNAVSVALSEGWWSGPSTYYVEGWNYYGDRQAFIGRLAIEYADGSREDIVTDPASWQVCTDGSRLYSSMMQGEVVDGRRPYLADDGTWMPASAIADNDGAYPGFDFSDVNFVMQADAPVHAVDTLVALSRTEARPGVWVYDMGQNCAGVPIVTLRGQKPGTEVTFRYAEVLYPVLDKFGDLQGEILTENLRSAHVQDKYICRGGKETFSPRQTMHGYKYIEITGTDTPPLPEDVRTAALSSVTGIKAAYECSDSAVNKLWSNICWSMLGNFVSIPTDCPQRNERMGWSGDINVFSHTAVYLADVEGFLRRHLLAIRDCQADNGRFPDIAPMRGEGFGGLLWGSAGIVVPWQMWRQWGDKEMLAEHYPAMRRYIDFFKANAIDPATGLIVQTYPNWGDLGDWLSPENDLNDNSLLWEAYYIYDLDIMASIAKVLGKEDDAALYADMASDRRAFFNRTYVDADGRTVHSAFGDGKRKGQPIGTYSSYILPIALRLCDEATTEKMASHLIKLVEDNDYALNVGFVGVPWICEAFSMIGRPDIAYRVLCNDKYPSWLYSVRQGSTTIWERLNAYVEGEGYPAGNAMNSFNHYSFGSVGSWMIERSLGICRGADTPGFEHFLLQPEPDTTGSITWAKGHLDTRNGRIESEWLIGEEGKVHYRFVVPQGTTATLMLPGEAKPVALKAGEYNF